MKKVVFFRVDADASTGLGHFFRCLALAEFIRAHFEIKFVCKNINSVLIDRVAEEYHFFKIRNEMEFFRMIKKGSIVVVDGYQFQQKYFQKLKKADAKVVSVQDVQRFTDNIDLVINHLPGIEQKYQNVEILSGPEYAIIRKKILRKNLMSRKETGFLISLGGTNNSALINKIIGLLKQLYDQSIIRVLTTRDNAQDIIDYKGVELYFDQSEEEIIRLIDHSEFCIITSGMISYEVLARNKRAIVGALNEGQAEIGERFSEMRLVEYVGLWQNIDLRKLKAALKVESIERNVVKNLFDGKSDERILKRILEL